jgi:hypothetical protein
LSFSSATPRCLPKPFHSLPSCLSAWPQGRLLPGEHQKPCQTAVKSDLVTSFLTKGFSRCSFLRDRFHFWGSVTSLPPDVQSDWELGFSIEEANLGWTEYNGCGVAKDDRTVGAPELSKAYHIMACNRTRLVLLDNFRSSLNRLLPDSELSGICLSSALRVRGERCMVIRVSPITCGILMISMSPGVHLGSILVSGTAKNVTDSRHGITNTSRQNKV